MELQRNLSVRKVKSLQYLAERFSLLCAWAIPNYSSAKIRFWRSSVQFVFVAYRDGYQSLLGRRALLKQPSAWMILSYSIE
jgi:hypothetical protein